MTTYGTVAAVALGLVFEWSGIAKVASRTAWQVEGTPFSTGRRSLDRLVRAVLPWFEIALGVLLIVRLAPAVVGTVCVVVLAAFTVALIRVLAAGQRPPCMCFGVARARPVSWSSVARNVVLLGVAVAVIAGA
jgi:hypothetical protein